MCSRPRKMHFIASNPYCLSLQWYFRKYCHNHEKGVLYPIFGNGIFSVYWKLIVVGDLWRQMNCGCKNKISNNIFFREGNFLQILSYGQDLRLSSWEKHNKILSLIRICESRNVLGEITKAVLIRRLSAILFRLTTLLSLNISRFPLKYVWLWN
jgi:hypothetical protein